MNSAKKNMDTAVARWEDDLDFIRHYQLHSQATRKVYSISPWKRINNIPYADGMNTNYDINRVLLDRIVIAGSSTSNTQSKPSAIPKANEPTALKVGMYVHHKTYGRGEVVDFTTTVGIPCVTIQFATGQRQFSMGYARQSGWVQKLYDIKSLPIIWIIKENHYGNQRQARNPDP